MQQLSGVIVAALLIAVLCWWLGAGEVLGFIGAVLVCIVAAYILFGIVFMITRGR